MKVATKWNLTIRKTAQYGSLAGRAFPLDKDFQSRSGDKRWRLYKSAKEALL